MNLKVTLKLTEIEIQEMISMPNFLSSSLVLLLPFCFLDLYVNNVERLEKSLLISQ